MPLPAHVTSRTGHGRERDHAGHWDAHATRPPGRPLQVHKILFNRPPSNNTYKYILVYMSEYCCEWTCTATQTARRPHCIIIHNSYIYIHVNIFMFRLFPYSEAPGEIECHSDAQFYHSFRSVDALSPRPPMPGHRQWPSQPCSIYVLYEIYMPNSSTPRPPHLKQKRNERKIIGGINYPAESNQKMDIIYTTCTFFRCLSLGKQWSVRYLAHIRYCPLGARINEWPRACIDHSAARWITRIAGSTGWMMRMRALLVWRRANSGNDEMQIHLIRIKNNNNNSKRFKHLFGWWHFGNQNQNKTTAISSEREQIGQPKWRSLNSNGIWFGSGWVVAYCGWWRYDRLKWGDNASGWHTCI